MRIAILCCASSRLFLPPVEKLLASGGHVTRRFESASEAVNWAGDGGIFVEWARSEAVEASALSRHGAKIIVRCHRYEVDEPQFLRIKWGGSVWPTITSKHVIDRALAAAPGCGPVFVPSIVDFDAFPLQAPPLETGLKIAVVGYLEGRKQPGLALAAFREIARDWRAKLTFVGEPKEPYWARYLAAQGATVLPWTDDPASIWKTHNVVLCASADEGCPYNVIEAMACGAMPLVHRYEGADAQFPAECLWSEVGDLNGDEGAIEKMRAKWAPETLRAWAFERYSIEANREKFLNLFERGR